MTPLPYRVLSRHEETSDTVTLTLAPAGEALPPWRPGQFTMVYALGVGEIPISISGGEPSATETGIIQHTVRSVGAVSAAVCAAPIGSTLGLRGPFGVGWPQTPTDADIVVMAGGIGLAPLRPVVTEALLRPGQLYLLIGARTPSDLVFTHEYDDWRKAGAQVLVTVDRAEGDWTGDVGVVTTLLGQVDLAPDAAGYVCGPEVMMRLGALALVDRGMSALRVALSLERNMRCGEGLCGHCQLGPVIICRDGPVFDFDFAQPLFHTREL